MEKLQTALNSIYGKILAFSVTAILTLTGWMYTDMKNKIDVLDSRVNILFQEKVSRSELKDELTRIMIQNDNNKTDILYRQQQMKEDIISRMEFFMKSMPNNNKEK